MRVVVNQRRVRRNRQIAQYAFFITLGILILGLFVTNASPSNPLLLLAPLVVLPVGLIATLYSVRMANLWLRVPRPETVLSQGLKSLSSRSTIYHYYFPARHVLITPQGIYSLTARPQDGHFTITGNAWRRRGGFGSKLQTFFRQDSVGDPHRDAEIEARRTQEFIARTLAGASISVQPLIVLTGLQIEVEVENSPIPVLYADNKKKPSLKSFFREIKKEAGSPALDEGQIATLEQALGIQSGEATEESASDE